MPVGKVTITGRRCADNAVSEEFGGNGCGTHSPNRERPGPIYISINDRASLKTVEDTLDAIICAWVGCEYVKTRAESIGDENAAIWTPVSGS